MDSLKGKKKRLSNRQLRREGGLEKSRGASKRGEKGRGDYPPGFRPRKKRGEGLSSLQTKNIRGVFVQGGRSGSSASLRHLGREKKIARGGIHRKSETKGKGGAKRLAKGPVFDPRSTKSIFALQERWQKKNRPRSRGRPKRGAKI